MYWVKSSVVQQLPISGILIDTCTLSIKANQWNAISYLPQLNLPVKTALANYEAQEGDVIKGQNAFAMFYNNSWVGSIQ